MLTMNLVILVVKINVWLGVVCGVNVLIEKRHPFFTVVLCRLTVPMLGILILMSHGPALWTVSIIERSEFSIPGHDLGDVAVQSISPNESTETASENGESKEQGDRSVAMSALSSAMVNQVETILPSVQRDVSELTEDEPIPGMSSRGESRGELAVSKPTAIASTVVVPDSAAIKNGSLTGLSSTEVNGVHQTYGVTDSAAGISDIGRMGWLETLLRIAFGLWIVVVVGQFAVFFATIRRTRRLVARARMESQPAFPIGEIARNAIGARRVAVLISSEIESPCLSGIFSSTILIPRRLFNERHTDSSQLLQFSILHETIHAVRHDLAWHLVLECLKVILWPLPWGWMLVRSHLFACERVCDEWSARYLGDRQGYRIGLARIASQVIEPTRFSAALFMAKRPEIFQRLDLLRESAPSLKLGIGALSSSCMFVVLALLIASLGYDQENAKADELVMTTLTESTQESNAVETPVVEEIPEVIETSVAGPLATKDTSATEDLSTDDSIASTAKSTPKPSETNTPTESMRPLRFARDRGASIPMPSEPTPRMGLMRGRVIDPMGRPVEGAQVVVGTMESTRGVPVQVGAKTTTDANGEWTWDIGRNPGVSWLRIDHKRYHSMRFPVRVTSTIHETRLVPLHQFAGRVVDENDKPVSDATVMGTWSIHNLMQNSSGIGFAFISEQKSNEDGVWQAHSKETNLSLIATRGAGEFGVLRDVEAGEAISIRLRPPKTLQFTIVDESGQSLSGVTVTPISWLFAKFGIHAKSTVDGGIVRFQKAPRIHSFWRLEKPGYRTRWIEVAEEQSLEQVTMYTPNTILAQVVDDLTGISIPLCTVDYEYTRIGRSLASTEQVPAGGKLPSWMNERAVKGKKTVSNGNVQLESNLDFEWLNLKIESEGYVPFHCEPISQETSQRKRTIRLHKLPVTRIVDSDGKPILNSSLDVYTNQGRYDKPVRSLRTDDRGNVTLPALGRDELLNSMQQLLISMEQGYAFLERSPFAKLPKTPNEIKLRPWGSVQIPIPHGENKILPKTVTWTKNLGQLEQFTFESKARIETNGFIIAPCVPSGDDLGIKLKIDGESDCNFKTKITPRETSTVDPYGTYHVKGKLNFLTQAPEGFLINCRGLYVVRRDTENLRCLSKTANSGKQGEFHVENIPPGSYTAHVFWSLIKEPGPNVDESLSVADDLNRVHRTIESGQNQFEFAIKESANKATDLGQVSIRIDRQAATEPFLKSRKVNDPFQGTAKVAFITETKLDWYQSEIRFWARDGRCVRTLSVASNRKALMPQMTLGVQKKRDRFYISTGREIRGFRFDGTDIDSFEVAENCLASILGSDQEDVCVMILTPSRSIHILSLSSGRRLTESLPHRLGNVVYSQKDNSLWMSASNDRNRSTIRQEVIRVSLDQRMSETRFHDIAASHLEGTALLESDRGGVWTVDTCTSAEDRTPPWYALSRVQSDGKFKTKLVPRFLGAAEASDQVILRYDDQIVAIPGDMNKLSSLEIPSSYIADSPRSDMFWLQSGEDLVRVRVSESGMNVEERVKGVRGDRFFVVSDDE